MQWPLNKCLVEDVIFQLFYVHNLESGANCFSTVLFLRRMRGGDQGRPQQHPVSHEVTDPYAAR